MKQSLGPRRKVIRTERIPKPDWIMQFTLECGHIVTRTKHRECVTISCEYCRRDAQSVDTGKGEEA